MEKGKRKILIYAVVALGLVILTSQMLVPKGNFRFMETSLLTIMKNIAEENKPEPPDLAIENVSLKKISDPSSDFNYYKYSATVVIKNHGGGVQNAQLVLSGKGQKNVFISNEETGFALRRDQVYILEGYDLIFDGDYNGGEITLNVDLKNADDYFRDNNSYKVQIFELPAKIDNFGIKEIRDDVGFVTTFEPAATALLGADYFVATSDLLESENTEARYDELPGEEKIYGYRRIKNSEDIAWSQNWKTEKIVSSNEHFLKFAADPFVDETTHYAYIKAVDPETGYFAVSNVLAFDDQRELSRADFAKLFVDYAEIDVRDQGPIVYQDVEENAWYTPYVQTLYNLGMLKDGSYKYYPDKPMKRGEILRVVLDYYDADLASGGAAEHFSDVSENHYLYPYLEAMRAARKGGVFGESFGIELPATKGFLKYLVDEYNENS